MPTILDVWGAQTRFPSIADAAAINSTHRHATNEAYKEATAFYADDGTPTLLHARSSLVAPSALDVAHSRRRQYVT